MMGLFRLGQAMFNRGLKADRRLNKTNLNYLKYWFNP